LLALTAFACSPKPKPLPGNHFIPGIASPLRFSDDQAEIFVADFVPDPEIIDSIVIDGRRMLLAGDKTSFTLKTDPETPPMFEMRLYSRGNWQSVPVMKSRKMNYSFVFDPGGKEFQSVQLAADFNGWTPSRTELALENGKWTVPLSLDPGRYQYQVVTDGKWHTDPANPDSADNNNGGFNSILKIGLQDRSLLPLLFAREFEDKAQEINIGFANKPSGLLVFWQNILLEPAYFEIEENEFDILIPKDAAGMKRSFLRVFAWNEHGFGNDLLIPLENGKVLSSGAQLNRNDLQGQIIYNVFIDRFFNGNPANDEPINDPSLVLPPADYHGGDIAGITEKIKAGYFTELGMNTLWISPVVLNPKGAYGQWSNPKTKFSAYHGYWPISFTLIDPRLGTPEDLKELVQEAHARDISVLLDFVAHHVHELHPYYIQHPDRTTSLYLPDGTLNTEKWDEHRLTTWFDVFLPTLDLQNPEVTEMLADSAVWWIKEYGLDGFRHDATKHVPEIFWRTLTQKLKQQVVLAENRGVYQIGETYGSPQLISSYVSSGMLDGQFDFNVYDAALGVFTRPSDPFTNLDQTLRTSFDYYGYNNLMGYISGNQDRGRFISYAGGDLKFSENAKEAGWTRTIGVGDTIGYRKLAMLNAFNMTIPGLPVIYYGDELGIPGGNDPDSRRMMKFESLEPLESRTRETVASLALLRKNNLALVYGNFSTIQVTEKTYVFVRKYFDQVVIALFNKGDDPASLEVMLPDWLGVTSGSPRFGHPYTMEGITLRMELPPWSFEILYQ
jgi:glycosidase